MLETASCQHRPDNAMFAGYIWPNGHFLENLFSKMDTCQNIHSAAWTFTRKPIFQNGHLPECTFDLMDIYAKTFFPEWTLARMCIWPNEYFPENLFHTIKLHFLENYF